MEIFRIFTVIEHSPYHLLYTVNRRALNFNNNNNNDNDTNNNNAYLFQRIDNGAWHNDASQKTLIEVR